MNGATIYFRSSFLSFITNSLITDHIHDRRPHNRPHSLQTHTLQSSF